MKKFTIILVTAIFCFLAGNSFSQGVAINESGESSDPSAMLDVKSLNKGLLVPRMTNTQRDQISDPAIGLMVYQTDQDTGFYYYNGTLWTLLGAASAGASGWQAGVSGLYYVEGNVGIGTATPTASLEVTGLIRYTPSLIPFTCEQGIRGSVYFDDFLNELCYCNGESWMQLDGGGICQCPDMDYDGNDSCEPDNPYDWDGMPADCDDYDQDVYYGATEICDYKDNDCDGEVDESPAGQTWYFDNDFDGWGSDTQTMFGCEPIEGYVEEGGDCDDYDPEINPGAIELCNSKDDDCDRDIDEEGYCPPGGPHTSVSCDALNGICSYECWSGWLDCNGDIMFDGCEFSIPATVYQDSDGDGYGNPLVSLEIYDCPGTGWSLNSLDCDDTDSDIHPGATENCSDGVDNDCDGLTDSEDPDCL